MESASLGFLGVPAEQIVKSLQDRQYLHPHRALGEALSDAASELGFCPGAAQEAVNWLGLDHQRQIGRLRASELMQLARCIYRFWTNKPVQNISQ